MKNILNIIDPSKLIVPDAKHAPYGNGVLAWMWFFIRPYFPTFLFHSIHVTLRTCFFMSLPLFMAIIIEMFETGVAFEDNSTVWFTFSIFSAAMVIISTGIILAAGQHNFIDMLSRTVSLFSLNHILGLSIDWHELSGSGNKLQRVLKARESVKRLMDSYFWTILQYISMFLTLIASILTLKAPSIFLGLFFLYIATYMFVTFLTGIWLRKGHTEHNTTMETVVGKVYEFLNSVATVKAFTMTKHLSELATDEEYKSHAAWRSLMYKNFLRWAILNILAAVWCSIIIGLGIYYTLHDQMSFTALALIGFMATSVVWDRLEYLAREIAVIIQDMTGIEQLLITLNSQTNVKEKDNATALEVSKAGIEFNDVTFIYENDKVVLDNLSFTVQHGQRVGLVGSSGAGKSTLVKLLMRLYDPNRGHVHIDGHDIRGVTLETLRQNIAVIPQDVALFNHPIIDNIRYGRLDATDEEVIEAARQAHADEFINDLPDKYQTVVGERGVKLSGGQRQRVAIARAILKNAPILVLDEATSALDSESEMLIQESLKELMTGKSVIAIAHRLSTIAHMDRLIIMDRGQIIEDGSHKDLVKQDGIYAKLWNMQSGGFLKQKQ